MSDDTTRNMTKIQLIVIGSAVAYATATPCLSRTCHHHRVTVARDLRQ